VVELFLKENALELGGMAGSPVYGAYLDQSKDQLGMLPMTNSIIH
jgi:hypothetical protein